MRRADGINLTNPVRTVCDLAARLTPEDLASVIEQVLNDFRYRFITVLRTANRLTRPGWAGAKRLTEVLNGRPPHAAPQDSHLEIAFRHALTRAGLPTPAPQLPIVVGGDLTVHADLGYPDARLVIEVDHRTWHSGEQIAIDKRRDRLVKLAGFDTLRVTDDDLRYHRDRTVAEVAAIYGQAIRGR